MRRGLSTIEKGKVLALSDLASLGHLPLWGRQDRDSWMGIPFFDTLNAPPVIGGALIFM